LYTAADFELDERHVIKNEKVALDRLRVRQNVFLVFFSVLILLLVPRLDDSLFVALLPWLRESGYGYRHQLSAVAALYSP